MKAPTTLQETASLLVHLGFGIADLATGLSDVLAVTSPELSVPVTAEANYERGQLKWVSIRAPGVQTRSVFQTQDPAGMAKAIARSIMAVMLELAALVEAPEPLPSPRT